MTYQLIVPMTGLGQRFVNAGYKELKPLIKINGKTILEHIMIKHTKATRIICIISAEHSQKHILRTEINNLRSDAVIVEIPSHKLGPGYAIWQSRSVINLELKTLISYCDWSGIWNLEKMLGELDENDGSILTYTGFHPHMLRENKYAYVKKDSQNRFIIDIKEKSSFTNNPMNEEASAGCYGFKSGLILLQSLEEQLTNKILTNGEYYISQTYLPMILKKMKITSIVMQYFFQWGTPEDLQDWMYWIGTIKNLKCECKSNLDGILMVLAAGEGKRLESITSIPKPQININGKELWEFSCPNNLKAHKKTIITRNNLIHINREDCQVIHLEEKTSGQASTAYEGLKTLNLEEERPVHILSCDNVFSPDNFNQVNTISRTNESDLVVWTANKYPIAKYQAENYSWIANRNSKFELLLKDAPSNLEEWQLIIGNFTFRNVNLAKELILELFRKKITINNEYYLDSIINLALEKNLKVSTFQVNNFMAIGTTAEYRTLRYYEEIIKNYEYA